MPRLWTATVASHREQVREAVIRATSELVAEGGAAALSMSHIAERSGIARGTLYRYFGGVAEILTYWHDELATEHVRRLTDAADRQAGGWERLSAVLSAYAHSIPGSSSHLDAGMSSFLHAGERIQALHEQVLHVVGEAVAEAVAAGAVRNDVPVAEIAAFCLNALNGAGDLGSDEARQRLLTVVLQGITSLPRPA